jgi:CRISPR/Cas system-associated exonuclease Cas4 (RecB family)
MIWVSDLRRFMFCPRAVYLVRVLGLAQQVSVEAARAAVSCFLRRRISLSQDRALARAGSAGGILSSLHLELDNAASDVLLELDGGLSELAALVLPEVRLDVLSELGLLAGELEAMVDDLGFDQALEYVRPSKLEHLMHSPALGLSGRVDKIMRHELAYPVQVRTGDFFWDGDGVQLCAYGLLLEEESGQRVPYGFVDYVRSLELRPVLFSQGLRDRVFQVRDEVEDILGGAVPDVCCHGQVRKCAGCGLENQCFLF